MLRALDAVAGEIPAGGTGRAPLRVVDLGCGNAYLTLRRVRAGCSRRPRPSTSRSPAST